MEDSQSSDIFPEAADDDTDNIFINPSNYNPLLSATKELFDDYHEKIREIEEFSVYFAKAIKDTWTCINHSLEDQIKKLLGQQTVPINKVANYLDDSLSLLQTLCQFYQTIITLVPVSCATMKTFPKKTGLIILTVFEHCKDSESLYGQQLKSLEVQLKDLFRACHELQLIYLTILEKQFIFKLDIKEEKCVLIEALRINLKIGQVVQSLDVKSMAVQWKGVTAICEKYGNEIADTEVCDKITQVLCILVKGNMDCAFQLKQDEKVIIRSLKLTSFTLKLVLKMFVILRQSSKRDHYSHIVGLLLYIEKKTESCLEMSNEKLIILMNTNVTNPCESLLEEALLYEDFVDTLFNSLTPMVDNCGEGHQIGCLLLLASAMKSTIQLKRRQNNLKMRLVSAVYSFLPNSHMSLNTYQHITDSSQRSYGPIEHVLLSMAALATTMTNEEFNALEKCMFEAILGTECLCALFSTQLWMILARNMNPQLLFIQIVWLCTMYKKLNPVKHFSESPQDIHLSHLISNLFNLLDDENKLKICKQFRMHDEDNISLWTAIRICNLPEETMRSAEEFIADKLKMVYKRFFNSYDEESFKQFIKITNLAATCTFKNTREIEDLLIRAWSKVCQEKVTIVHSHGSDTSWFYDYVKALAALTAAVVEGLSERSAHFMKVLHVINALITTGDNVMKVILTRILCKMATYQLKEHDIEAESHYIQSFRLLFQNQDDIIHQFFANSREYVQNRTINVCIECNYVVPDINMINIWNDVKSRKYDLKGSHSKYSHQCLRQINYTGEVLSLAKTTNGREVEFKDDFYLDSAGFEMQTEDTVEEPCSKRVKTKEHEADTVIRVLEENASLLVKLNVVPDQIKRIQKVWETLKNISQ